MEAVQYSVRKLRFSTDVVKNESMRFYFYVDIRIDHMNRMAYIWVFLKKGKEF